MSIFERIQEFPPLLQYLIFGVGIAVLAFCVNSLLPKKQARVFDGSLLLRYLALGAIFAGAIYLVYNHRDVLHV